jgi:predicted Zn-dependent peptidase
MHPMASWSAQPAVRSLAANLLILHDTWLTPPRRLCHNVGTAGRRASGKLFMVETRNIRREVLSNGLILLSEEMRHIRSVSIGIWVKTGSRHEAEEGTGIAHFAEHMVFKGTRSRTAEDIARQVDSIGGNIDAFTAKECVCFNIKVLDEHLPVALDILSDLVLNPVFNADDITRERGVILEELKMDQDSPDYLVHEIFTQNFWKDHRLGKPILGTKESVRRFDQPLLREHYQRHFHAANFIVSAAGNLDHARFAGLVAQRFHSLPALPNGLQDTEPRVQPHIILRNKKSLEQVQICVGVPSPPISHQDRYTSYILNTVLGGGMSSRLFQNIRERRGLAYAIFSELNPYRDTGCLSIYAGTSRAAAGQVLDCIVREFRNLKAAPVPADELRRAKDQLKGSLLLSLESTTARMSSLARQEMYFDRFVGMDEIAERIEAVTAEELTALARRLFQTGLIAVTVLGNLNGFKLGRDQLAC